MFKKNKTAEQLEREFAEAAKKSARMPGHDNRTKAQKAYEALPEKSKQRVKGIKFEGKKSWW